MNDNKDRKNSSGLVLGLCLGVSLGTAIGAATDNMGLWLALGPAFGLLFSLAFGHQSASSEEEGGKIDEENKDKE